MATLRDYAHLAVASYKVDEEEQRQGPQAMLEYLAENGLSRFSLRFWQAGTSSNGFQGMILEDNNEVICAFKGSKTKRTAKRDWLVNDVQIALNMIPSQANSAAEMVEVAERCICGGRDSRVKPLSIVGHSLGGGLAQLVGYLRGVPFVSFNGPGMVGNVELLPFLGVKKRKNCGGFNMIIWTDPVGNYGRHIGKTERFLNRGSGFPHMMAAVMATLEQNKKWADRTLDQLV
jgi:hypothetical protein